MNRYVLEHLTLEQVEALIQRPSGDYTDIVPLIESILNEVCTEGDKALKKFTRQFDGVEISNVAVPDWEFSRSTEMTRNETTTAIASAAENIRAFHLPQVPQPIIQETKPGVICRREWRPIQRVGLYIPGGSAPLISTVSMLAVPATLAGCPEIILCTPPLKNGTVPPDILFAANFLGVSNVYKVGGGQAIAAMAVGTESIRKVDKIFGPGNRYVAAAKSAVSKPPYNVAINMHAGPTELLIIADDTANPRWVAADLLSQAEHGTDSIVVLVTTSISFAEKVKQEVCIQMPSLPRQQTIKQSLERSFTLVVKNLDEAIEFSNKFAPEHLILALKNVDDAASKLKNAGSVFLGSYSSVVLGDYASGTNHTLPTGGAARSMGGITVESFMKPIFFQQISEKGFRGLAGTVQALARAEQLEAHAQAIEVRGKPND